MAGAAAPRRDLLKGLHLNWGLAVLISLQKANTVEKVVKKRLS